MSPWALSVEEVPVEAEAEYAAVEGVVGREEIVAFAGAVDVAHEDIEAAALQLEVGVEVAEGVVAHRGAHRLVLLHDVRLQLGAVFRRVVFCEVAHIDAEVCLQHACDFEAEIEVGVDVELRQGQDAAVGCLLPCDDIVPVEDAEAEVLAELCRDDLYV